MKRHAQKVMGALAIIVAATFAPSADADLFSVTDVNADPDVFECDLTAVEHDVLIGGATVHTLTYKDEAVAAPPSSAGIPIQVIKVKVGEKVICRFRNDLPAESTSIHWHGIELDNDSDGTAVTQDAVLPGQSYTYQFLTFRPGTYWFHSHMMPGNTLFAGMYGVIIIENDIEASLKGTVIPDDASTFTLAMSDIEFDPATGKVGKQIGGAGPYLTENELIELCHLDGIGDPGGSNPACGAAGAPGTTVLVNGNKPDAGAQTPMFTVASGQRIRLRLLNESVSRHFRMKLVGSGDNKLYRIGGQGGLLDNVILEGGTKGTLVTGYDAGEIAIGSGERADVIIVPSGAEGAIIQLVGNKLLAPFKLSTGLPADYPIAYFKISGTSSDNPPLVGDPILAGTAEDIENIKTGGVITPLIDPVPPPFAPGSSDETIRLTNTTPTGPVAFVRGEPGIDAYAAALDSNTGNGDFLVLPRPPIARYAHVGDVLELTVRNETDAVHPYHLHGFSMQPVRFEKNDGTLLYNFDYDEFLDTIDVYAGQSYVFRVRVDDRPKICDISPDLAPNGAMNPGPVLAPCTDTECGGVVGRWLFHCHIVSHGALGMIGEITILPGPDTPPDVTCPADILVGNDPGLCSAVVNFVVSASDDCGIVSLDVSPPSGSIFPVGDTLVTATATDTSGQVSECTFTVTVEDQEDPQVTSSVTTASLWSPSPDLINVGFTATATDNCPGPIAISVQVFSDEIEAPPGGSQFSPDAKDIASTTLRLRSERLEKGNGRVYLIVTTATDGAGNQSHSCATVVVPHSQKAGAISSANAQAAAAKAFCEANDGGVPPGFVMIGIGPVIGPKQ